MVINVLNVNGDIVILTKIFSQNGEKLYLVGGAVRDLLLNKEPHDFDFATSCLPDKIEILLAGYDVDTKGKKFGSFSFNIKDIGYQITTFRIEYYNKAHYPKQISFTKNLIEDSLRRDFTINSIYYIDGKIIDPQKGLKDLKKRIIRLIGDPDRRLKEDPSRIIRAIRMSVNFDFKIEKNTLKAILRNKNLIGKLSKNLIEREVSLINIANIENNPLKDLILPYYNYKL